MTVHYRNRLSFMPFHKHFSGSFPSTKYTNFGANLPPKSFNETAPWSKCNVLCVPGLPYSEHSSYTELKRFTQFVRPDSIIPTVNNGNPTTRHRMQQLFQSWLKESPSDSPRMKQARLGQWLK